MMCLCQRQEHQPIRPLFFVFVSPAVRRFSSDDSILFFGGRAPSPFPRRKSSPSQNTCPSRRCVASSLVGLSARRLVFRRKATKNAECEFSFLFSLHAPALRASTEKMNGAAGSRPEIAFVGGRQLVYCHQTVCRIAPSMSTWFIFLLILHSLLQSTPAVPFWTR